MSDRVFDSATDFFCIKCCRIYKPEEAEQVRCPNGVHYCVSCQGHLEPPKGFIPPNTVDQVSYKYKCCHCSHGYSERVIQYLIQPDGDLHCIYCKGIVEKVDGE